MEIQHFSHPHPLVLKSVDASQISGINCAACGRSCLDLIYACSVCKNYHLHKSCAELPRQITHHPFHPLHPLPLVFKRSNFACCGCGQWDSNLIYYCIPCNFTMSPDCALKPTTKYEFVGDGRIRYFLHKHPLAIVDMKEEADAICLACEESCMGETYACHECPNFKMHKACADQLPRAIQHSSHPAHPLILRAKDSYFDRACVACKRTDNILTYRCSMCRFEMDPECALTPPKHLI